MQGALLTQQNSGWRHLSLPLAGQGKTVWRKGRFWRSRHQKGEKSSLIHRVFPAEPAVHGVRTTAANIVLRVVRREIGARQESTAAAKRRQAAATERSARETRSSAIPIPASSSVTVIAMVNAVKIKRQQAGVPQRTRRNPGRFCQLSSASVASHGAVFRLQAISVSSSHSSAALR